MGNAHNNRKQAAVRELLQKQHDGESVSQGAGAINRGNKRSSNPAAQDAGGLARINGPAGPLLRCFSCRCVLVQPAGTEQFQCPMCFKLLDAESSASPGHRDENIVNCPRCLHLCYVTEGTLLMPCPSCGFHLQRMEHKTGSRPVSTKETALVSTLPLESSVQYWRRRVISSEKLGWSRVWTKQEEADVAEAEENFIAAMIAAVQEDDEKEIDLDYSDIDGSEDSSPLFRDFSNRYQIDSLEELELHLRFMLGDIPPIRTARITIENVLEEIVSKYNSADLRRILDNHAVDYTHLRVKRDLARRFFCLQMTMGKLYEPQIRTTVLSRDLVRSFTIKHDREISLDVSSAYHSQLSTRLGTELSSSPALIKSDEVLTVLTSFPFYEKVQWFVERIETFIKRKWEDGYVKLRVRRSHILEDSLNAISKLNADDMKRFSVIEFIGEPGQDGGGIAREWFCLVAQLLFEKIMVRLPNGTYHLKWQQGEDEKVAEDDTLQALIRFAGRLIGRALFEGINLEQSLSPLLYKHILGMVVSETNDLKHWDDQIAQSIELIRMSKDVVSLGLDFSLFGDVSRELTNENKLEYCDMLSDYYLMGNIRHQLKELLTGIYEVIPLSLLSVFDPAGLDLFLCGLHDIDVNDWRANTVYEGEYTALGEQHEVIHWFWEVVLDLSLEDKARLLQFATGATRVPAQGFCALHHGDGTIRLFTLQSVPLDMTVYPRAHTCFNRIDLPLYPSKEEMKRKTRLTRNSPFVRY